MSWSRKPNPRTPLTVCWRPQRNEIRATFQDFVLILRLPGLHHSGVQFRAGGPVFDAEGLEPYAFSVKQQNFVDACAIAHADAGSLPSAPASPQSPAPDRSARSPAG